MNYLRNFRYYLGYLFHMPLPVCFVIFVELFTIASVMQISKLSMIPVVCVMEWILHSKHYSREVKMSVLVVVVGVGVCTVTDVKVNAKGFICACVAVLSTSLQQIVSSYLDFSLPLCAYLRTPLVIDMLCYLSIKLLFHLYLRPCFP